MACESLTKIKKHIKKEHDQCNIDWMFEICEKTAKSSLGLCIHFSHCNGPPTQKHTPFQCGHCDLSFVTQVGLSQHERHCHPAVRNTARMEDAERPKRQGGRPATVWSDPELARLMKFKQQYGNQRYINVSLSAHFPNMNFKQIGEARRRLRENAELRNRIMVILSQDRVENTPDTGEEPKNDNQTEKLTTINSVIDELQTLGVNTARSPTDFTESEEEDELLDALEHPEQPEATLNTPIINNGMEWLEPLRSEIMGECEELEEWDDWITQIKNTSDGTLNGESLEELYEDLMFRLVPDQNTTTETGTGSREFHGSRSTFKSRRDRTTTAQKTLCLSPM